MKEYCECPNCYEMKVVVERDDGMEIFRCESCGCHYEAHEWAEIHDIADDEF